MVSLVVHLSTPRSAESTGAECACKDHALNVFGLHMSDDIGFPGGAVLAQETDPAVPWNLLVAILNIFWKIREDRERITPLHGGLRDTVATPCSRGHEIESRLRKSQCQGGF